ncbi:hypothetical protein RND71_032729 [Anisodus tanguticus]|uniref:Uncharacterized protein n=1 Tax=Anisodus tanguticus TaxID=243964 RepID=A0AAE1V398_9SOLA|nr:hypothetical protein RND71_032729 [Anisodus tanguticus]
MGPFTEISNLRNADLMIFSEREDKLNLQVLSDSREMLIRSTSSNKHYLGEICCGDGPDSELPGLRHTIPGDSNSELISPIRSYSKRKQIDSTRVRTHAAGLQLNFKFSSFAIQLCLMEHFTRTQSAKEAKDIEMTKQLRVLFSPIAIFL